MQRSANARVLSSDDETVLVLLILGAAMAAAGSAPLYWTQLAGWLVRHQILAPAGQAVLGIPGAAGAGLDVPRLLIVTAAGVAILACLGSWVWHVIAIRRAAE